MNGADAGMQAMAAQLEGAQASSWDALHDPAAMTEAQGAPTPMTADAALFGDSLGAAASGFDPSAVSPVAQAVMEPLGMIDKEAKALGDQASLATQSGEAMTPAEIVQLTMRSQEFMFHSQLTSNVANRTADGLQQLFRQQG